METRIVCEIAFCIDVRFSRLHETTAGMGCVALQ